MKLNKRLSGWLMLASCLLLTACSQPTSQTPKGSEGQKAKLKIGITQIVEHPSLDAIREGFIAALKDNGFEDGKNIEIDYQSAQGEPTNTSTIAQKFVSDRKDLILAISTPSAQSIVKAAQGTNIPVLFSGITDPLSAKLVDNLEKPGKNVTGYSDSHPDNIQKTMEAMKELFPNAKKVGIIYNSGEVNAVVNVKEAKKALAGLGLEVVEANAANASEVKQAAESLVGRVDTIYLPIDNTVISALKAVVKVVSDNKIPLFVGETDSVRNGGFAGYGIDYKDHGYQTGLMAVKILKGEAKPGDMSVQFPKELRLGVNREAAAKQGIDLEKLKDKLEKFNPIYFDKIENK